MTKIQRILKALNANKGRKVTKLFVGQARKEIRTWNVSPELKRSAWRHVLRAQGHTNENRIELYASLEF